MDRLIKLVLVLRGMERKIFNTDGEAVEYVQGATDYTNCVWTSGCDGGVGSIEVTSFTSEGNWDYLNLFSDASLVTNSIGPAANNGGIDNSGDLGRFSGNQAPGTVAGVAAVHHSGDWRDVAGQWHGGDQR